MTRVEKVARAQELRAVGLSLREIAECLDAASVKTVSAWLTDPDLARQRARRKRYAKPCDWCEGPTDGSGGYKRQRHICANCLYWTDEAIIDAIQRWAYEHGGLPPVCVDWDTTDGSHPTKNVVRRAMGWNNALLRAGFGLRCDRRTETQEWIERQLHDGRSTREIADALGVGADNIRRRLYYRGKHISDYRRAA